MRHLLLVIILICFQGHSFAQKIESTIEKLRPELDAIISSDAVIEKIADGFTWCEGPLWVESEKMLLFSDVPNNIIYKWTKQRGKESYLSPSGYTGTIKRGGETGSNGLLLNKKNQLILCQHGDRKLALMNAPLDKPAPIFLTLASGYNGKKFDSPNDAALHSNGDLYFTDPPYGLEKNVQDPNKEAPYQGVYKLATNGTITLLTDSITRPNGIAFFPGEKRLLIANSDPNKPFWYVYDIASNGSLINGRIFYDATAASKTEPGMPDGLKIDEQGHVFASGPGGLWIFDAAGNVLGKIKVNSLVSNCYLSKDRTLYITAHKMVVKVQLKNY